MKVLNNNLIFREINTGEIVKIKDLSLTQVNYNFSIYIGEIKKTPTEFCIRKDQLVGLYGSLKNSVEYAVDDNDSLSKILLKFKADKPYFDIIFSNINKETIISVSFDSEVLLNEIKQILVVVDDLEYEKDYASKYNIKVSI